MIHKAMLLMVLSVLAVSCRKAPEAVEVTETRELTMWDDGTDPLIAPMPPEWRQIPSTQLRLYNYRFGEGSQGGEVYVSRARGGVLPNVNRWLAQFGKPEIDSLDDLPKIKVLGLDAVVVSASGRFGGGMGKPAQENAAVLGVIADHGSGLLTVKMIGPADQVAAERERMLKFCESLRIKQSDAETGN
ncbi:hypothetical protein JO972_08625 [Verrucomicrobiaceae bacterium 5K15]|uniref:Lipoprotein n=1 Tax=Oceaniferula flava TaxID=2800421 RepID=A0AAE2SEU3_9BACT|nr:hypothetical protein [Oceaniferula flavus]MBK1855021.1 hypothetical protein [Oceaniferula flavus]MBM1136327.1 hypothetical protein [Oceaniferula flavus]